MRDLSQHCRDSGETVALLHRWVARMAAQASLCQFYITQLCPHLYDYIVDLNIIIQFKGWRQYTPLKPFYQTPRLHKCKSVVDKELAVKKGVYCFCILLNIFQCFNATKVVLFKYYTPPQRLYHILCCKACTVTQ